MPPVRVAPRSAGAATSLYPLLAILLAVFAVAPLTHPGSIQNHNGLNAVYNLMDLHSRLAVPGWAPTFARGFDPLRGDGPLGYAVAEFFHLIGFSFPDSIKLVLALALLLSALGMFALARSVFRSQAAGLLAAAVYLYFPYHLAIVYVRGAFGEALVWAILPLALLAAFRLFEREQPARQDYVPAALLFALLILALPGLGLLGALAAPFALHFVARRKSRRPPVERAVGAGAVLAVVLLLPAVLQNPSAGSAFRFVPAFVQPFQLLTASWGAALPKGNYLEQFPYQVGIAGLGFAILALALLPRTSPGAHRVAVRAVLAAAAVLLLTTPLAAPLWQVSGMQLLVEYPFQLFVFAGLPLALAAGAIVTEPRLKSVPMLAALCIVPVLAVYAYLSPEYSNFVPSQPPLARFNDNELGLLGYKIIRPPGTFRHGATVEVELQWQAFREVNHDYTVFVHAVDETGKSWGGEDSRPQGGELPTTQWAVGRVISDTHSVQIDLAGPPEGYHLEIGLYTPNGERALTETGAEQVRIDENRQ